MHEADADLSGGTSERRGARNRRQRLQILVLLLFAVWFAARGPALPSSAATRTLPAVSSGPPSADLRARGISPRRGAPRVEQLSSLLLSVNSSLGARDASRIASAVLRSSEKHRLEPVLVTAVMLVESRVRPWARSPKGAVGLMQVMPHMMEPLQLAGNPATIESNIEAGCWILASNIRRLGEADGISSYFWGSEIRGERYLQKVRAARASLQDRLDCCDS